MKPLPLILTLAAALVAGSATIAVADPVFYVDFDNATDGTYACWTDYASDGTEVTDDATKMYFVSQKQGTTLGDGVVVKVPDGSDGANYPSTVGPQGGKAILLDSGLNGSSERTCGGLWVEMAQPYAIGDLTLEATFWAATNDIDGNVAGIQMILADEWPSGAVMRSCIRILGSAATPAGRQKNVECSYFTPTEFNIYESGETLTAGAWHTCQVVFDYNETTPASSTMTFYLDGVQKGAAATVDASSQTKVFGTDQQNIRATYDSGYSANSAFFIGCGASMSINPFESRGLRGAIDAVSISLAALDPADFVLPTGFTPAGTTGVDSSWSLYY